MLKRIKPTFHAPVIARVVRSESDRVDADPLPELDVLRHSVSFHLAFHLNIEYLQGLTGCVMVVAVQTITTTTIIMDV